MVLHRPVEATAEAEPKWPQCPVADLNEAALRRTLRETNERWLQLLVDWIVGSWRFRDATRKMMLEELRRRNYGNYHTSLHPNTRILLNDLTAHQTAWALSTFVNIKPSYSSGNCREIQSFDIWRRCDSSTSRHSKRSWSITRNSLIRNGCFVCQRS